MTKKNNQLDEKAIAIEQSLKYAKDLVAVYKKEQARRKNLETANQKIYAILNSISEGMIAIDNTYVITQVNKVMCRILNIPEKDLIGRNLPDILNLPELMEKLSILKDTDTAEDRIELELGSPVRHNYRISLSLLDRDKGYTIVFHDITSAKRAENMKDEFFSILSHELRTPLSGILGFSQILAEQLKEKLNGEQQEMFEMLNNSATQMNRIIEQLLGLARIKTNEHESLEEPLSLGSIINSVMLSLKPKCIEKNISTAFETSADSDTMTGNEVMIMKLFVFVIENAVIYGKQNGRLDIRLKKAGNQYEISIADDGIGMSENDLGNVFKSFYQVQGYLTRNYGGLGLGLTMAKHIAELHKGTISLESSLGKGTTCFITLPENLKA